MQVQLAGAHQLDSRCCPPAVTVLDNAEENAKGFHLPLNRFPRWLWAILILEQSRSLHKVHPNA
jgi:hypothetical protein